MTFDVHERDLQEGIKAAERAKNPSVTLRGVLRGWIIALLVKMAGKPTSS